MLNSQELSNQLHISQQVPCLVPYRKKYYADGKGAPERVLTQ